MSITKRSLGSISIPYPIGKKYCLEAVYSHYNRCEIPYLPSMNYDFCMIVASWVTITNLMRTMINYHYIEINSISYIVTNEYSNLNAVLFVVLLDKCLSSNIFVSLDYSCRIYFQSFEPFIINSMSYNMSLRYGINFHQLPMGFVELKLIGDDIIWDNW
jgi:hypothetical protein